jgi:hypothetical protein
MYEIDGLAEGTTRFEPGTSLVVTGERRETHEALVDLLAAAPEPAILVTTNAGARDAVEQFEARGALGEGRIGIIDCTAQESAEAETTAPVRFLGSPGDLTGISLEFAKLVKRLDAVENELRVGFSTVSTMLMYADTETVFRFLHVFTSRIRSGDWFGAFSLDPGMHDDQTTNTVRAVFDCEARIRGDGVDLRGSGFQR